MGWDGMYIPVGNIYLYRVHYSIKPKSPATTPFSDSERGFYTPGGPVYTQDKGFHIGTK